MEGGEMANYSTERGFAEKMDLQDPLSGSRKQFYIPSGTIYMDGNSLGLASQNAEKSLLRVMKEWKELGIRGWLDADNPWFFIPEDLGNKMASLMGARADEVIMTGSTTSNLHSLVSTFYKPWEGRRKIVADELNFPSDIYALKSQIRLRGLDPEKELVLVKSRDGRTIDEEDIMAALDESVSLAVLPGVLYRSGQLLDMKGLTEYAHSKGIIIGFDCAHSVGSVPHYFDDWDVDFAFWCSYKHLNGGPGSPAFLYLNRRHFEKEPGLAGWYGYKKEKQFDLAVEFDHSPTAGGWQMGTPCILSTAALEGALDLFCSVGIDAVRKKSLDLTSYLIYLVDNLLSGEPWNYSIGTPRKESRRGGHVAIEHGEEAWRICCALKARGIVPDFRPPSVIRIAPVALYNTYTEVWEVVNALREIIENREYEQFSRERDAVS
jgi:kynureninase